MMMTTTLTRLLAVALLAGLQLAVPSAAQAQNDPNVDPPTRAARLSDVAGQVWFYDRDAGEWIAAARNRPITAGDHLATDPGARAELQLGSSTVRLDSGTELEIGALDDARFALHLISGSVVARVPDLQSLGPFELNTDDGRFVVQRNGSYRFDRESNTSFASVYNGLVRYEGPNSGLPVNPGQRAEFWIDSGGVAQYSLGSPVNDAFAAWNNERDRQIAASAAARFVSPEMTGAEELDRYGRWEQSPDYGPLWVPTAVAVDWAPYRNGHWSWIAPWGWTWVDDAPWGFAPFHYGRWVNVHNNWCWTPGQRVERPVYAPALVAWFGGPRANVSVSAGGGPAVGWFPLAPREVYVPSYRVSQRYAQNVNITYVGNPIVINRVFENPQAPRDFGNRRAPGAVTIVPAAVMTSRQPVAPAWAQLRQNPAARELANQPPGRGVVALMTAPVAAPAVRQPDNRDVRPPPGFAERPNGPRAGFGPAERDRDGRGRDVGRPESPRPPQQAVVQPVQPVQQTPAQAMQPVRPMPPNVRQPAVMVAPPTAIAPPVVAPIPPVAQPAPLARPQVPTTVQEGPMMRALPIHRGEDRRDAPQGQPQSQPQVQVQPQMQRQPPAQPPPQMQASRRAEPQGQPTPPRVERAAPQVVQQTPAQLARPEPQRAPPTTSGGPEMKRPEPQHREQQQPGGEQRRGDPRDQQR